MSNTFQREITVEGLISLYADTDKKNPGERDREAMVSNTRMIQAVLDKKGGEGGGAVVIPPGTYWIRSVYIPSDTELHLSAGSHLVAWPYLEDYTIHRERNFTEEDSDNVDRLYEGAGGFSLILSHNTERASLTGRGVIDGNGFSFWEIPVREVLKQGGNQSDIAMSSHWEDSSPFWRAVRDRVTPLVEFDRCRNVMIRDITIADSPGWTLHTLNCDRVTIEDITIKNHLYGPNTDGIDINGCRDVVVRGCDLTCGDDAIIIKATGNARSCERISVSDCIIETHCAAFGIGAEVVYPIRDISVNNIVVNRALRMVQIELWTAGLVENVVISNMTGATMTDIPLERPLYIDIQHHERTDGALGGVRNIQIRGISAITRGRCLFTAADGATIEGLILDGIQLTYPEIEDPEISVTSSRSQQMSNSSPESRSKRSAFVFDNVNNALVSHVQIRWPESDKADKAGELRGGYDRGQLSEDKRKLDSLAEEPAMNAFLFRKSSRISVDAPFVEGNRASACKLIDENRRIFFNGEDLCS